MWFLKVEDWLKLRLQNLHTKGFSKVWIRMCERRLLRELNPLRHRTQWRRDPTVWETVAVVPVCVVDPLVDCCRACCCGDLGSWVWSCSGVRGRPGCWWCFGVRLLLLLLLWLLLVVVVIVVDSVKENLKNQHQRIFWHQKQTIYDWQILTAFQSI